MKVKHTRKASALLLLAALVTPTFAGANGGNLSISNVSPNQMAANESKEITVDGEGFSSDLKVGIIRQSKDFVVESDLTELDTNYVNDKQLTANVPSGLEWGVYDVYVYFPNSKPLTYAKKEGALTINIVTSSDITPTFQYNITDAARKKINVTFYGLSLDKKRWIKARINNKNVSILKLRRGENNTTITTILYLNVKYKRLAVGSYDLTLTYKNREKQHYQNQKGKVRQKNVWVRETATVSDFLTIVP